MSANKFEDIQIWQKSKLLCQDIYKDFNTCKDYGFKDQIQRAAISIMNNIAEGFERSSSKDFARFLWMAKGSCGEVRSMLWMADELGYITSEKRSLFIDTAEQLSKMIYNFIRGMKNL